MFQSASAAAKTISPIVSSSKIFFTEKSIPR
jgi:hypothetical protein